MWVEAMITQKDLTSFLRSVTPLEIDLGEGRVLVVGRPKMVELVARKGVRLQASAHVVWKVATIKVPATIRIARLLLMPVISKQHDKDALGFKLRIEKLDVKALPDFIDATVMHKINDELAKLDGKLVWNFSETLDFHWGLPKAIASADAIDLGVKWGAVKVTAQAMVLAVSMKVRAIPSTTVITHAAE